MKLKTLIYFIDGATWDLLDDWIAGGALPNIAKLKNGGAYGKLESVFPPMTHTALPAFFTGKSPVTLGLLNMEELDAMMLTSDRFSGDFLWDKLSFAGFRSLIVDIPFTYPPKPFNGVLFTGFYTPPKAADFAYPKEIPLKYPNYPKGGVEMMDYIYKGRYDDELLAAEYEITQKRFEVFFEELKSGQFDFACFYVKASDILQHFFWNRREELLKFYKMLDAQIGALLSECGAENFIVLSDHGFDDAAKETFFTNAWLYKNGYLKWKRGYDNFFVGWMKDFLAKNKTIAKKFYRLLWIFHTKKKRSEAEKTKGRDNAEASEISESIDLNQSIAYAVGGALRGKGIKINADGAEKEKIRAEIIDKLKDEKYNGLPIARFVKSKEEMAGASAGDKRLPDIFFLPQPRLFVNDRYSNCAVGKRITHSRALGHHLSSLYGVLIWKGDNINQGELKNLSLLDIYPTILNLYGQSAPGSDGRVVKEIFKIFKEPANSENLSEEDLIKDLIF